MPLFFTGIEQDVDGSMSSSEFERFLSNKITALDAAAGEGDLPSKCDRVFDAIDPSRTDYFTDPEIFRKALYNYYDLTPIDMSAIDSGVF